ncbi:MAG: hypothetical protein GY835_09785 [bacterium]|nr:hypothetical protein [bacterium]
MENHVDGYHVDIHWYANDPDGEVAYFMWAWTDSMRPFYSAWNPETQTGDRVPSEGDFDATHLTTRTDSTFILKANDNGGMSRDLTFSVTAVDDRGKRDPIPARLYFEASVDHRPRIVWVDVPDDTMGVGESDSCSFTYDAESVNGGFLGFQWQQGLETRWTPRMQVGMTPDVEVWSEEVLNEDGSNVYGDTISFEISNDVETESEWADFYKYGTYMVKAKCIDLAGVTSEVSLGDPENLVGAIMPILNRDPDTRLRPESGGASNSPVWVKYYDINGDEQAFAPNVEKISEWEGESFDPGFHYVITDTIPWGANTQVEFNFQGWDTDEPLTREDEDIGFQIDFAWETSNLLLPDYPVSDTSGGRFPPGGHDGLEEDFEIPGKIIYQPSGQSLFMNTGPFDYVVRGYSVDAWGRVDGTPTTIRFTAGFPSFADEVWIESSHYPMTGPPTTVNLTAIAEEHGEVVLALETFVRHPLTMYMPDLVVDGNTVYVTPDTVALDKGATGAAYYDSLASWQMHKLVFRINGHDDERNGISTSLGRNWFNLEDPDYPASSFDQLSPGVFETADGGNFKVWATLFEDQDPQIEDFARFSLECTELVYRAHFMGLGDYEQPQHLGEKTLSTAFCNTTAADDLQQKFSYIDSEGELVDEDLRAVAFVNIGLIGTPLDLDLDIVYYPANPAIHNLDELPPEAP